MLRGANQFDKGLLKHIMQKQKIYIVQVSNNNKKIAFAIEIYENKRSDLVHRHMLTYHPEIKFTIIKTQATLLNNCD